jgi:hypothetical protein
MTFFLFMFMLQDTILKGAYFFSNKGKNDYKYYLFRKDEVLGNSGFSCIRQDCTEFEIEYWVLFI